MAPGGTLVERGYMKVLRVLTSATGLAAVLTLLPACNRDTGTGAAGSASDSSAQSTGQGADQTSPGSHTYGDNKSPDAYPPDNTGKNTRDRSGATLTPGDQGTSEADRELARQVRHAITANGQLSATAKNIKIIARDGKVTLRGPVDSAQEKDLVESAARQAGATVVDDQLETKTTNN